MKKIIPLEDRVLIRKEEAEEVTPSGLILAGKAKDDAAPQWATVIAVGPGTEMIRMQVQEGDKVLCAKYGGTDIKVDNQEYVIYAQKDILAIVRDC